MRKLNIYRIIIFAMISSAMSACGILQPTNDITPGTNSVNSTDTTTGSGHVGPISTVFSISAGGNKTVQLPTNSMTLTSEITGSVNSITYDWVEVSGPTINLGIKNTGDLVLTGLVVGKYVFEVIATDTDGTSATDNSTVTVNASTGNAAVLTIKEASSVPQSNWGYGELLPPGYANQTSWPLLINLHGLGDCVGGPTLTQLINS